MGIFQIKFDWGRILLLRWSQVGGRANQADADVYPLLLPCSLLLNAEQTCLGCTRGPRFVACSIYGCVFVFTPSSPLTPPHPSFPFGDPTFDVEIGAFVLLLLHHLYQLPHAHAILSSSVRLPFLGMTISRSNHVAARMCIYAESSEIIRECSAHRSGIWQLRGNGALG